MILLKDTSILRKFPEVEPSCWGAPVKKLSDLEYVSGSEDNEHRVVLGEDGISYLARWFSVEMKWVVVPFSYYRPLKDVFEFELNRVYIVTSG